MKLNVNQTNLLAKNKNSWVQYDSTSLNDKLIPENSSEHEVYHEIRHKAKTLDVSNSLANEAQLKEYLMWNREPLRNKTKFLSYRDIQLNMLRGDKRTLTKISMFFLF